MEKNPGGEDRMKDIDSKVNYLRICKQSGCMIANYNIEDFDEESFIIPDNREEKSGRFKVSKSAQRYINETNDKENFEQNIEKAIRNIILKDIFYNENDKTIYIDKFPFMKESYRHDKLKNN